MTLAATAMVAMQTTTPSQVTHCPTAEPTNSRAGTSTAHSAEPTALRTPDRAGRELPVPLVPPASTAVPDALMSPELLSMARSFAPATIYNGRDAPVHRNPAPFTVTSAPG
jgi:hypothetical protein